MNSVITDGSSIESTFNQNTTVALIAISVEIAVPRARLDSAAGKTTEWKSSALRAYQRRTKRADSLIAGAYLAGANTRRVRRALSAVFGGAVTKTR